MMADLLVAASHQSSVGLKILMAAMAGVVLTLFCVWRKQKFKKMRKLRSSFFHRKQRRFEQKNGKSKQNTGKKHSTGKLIQRKGPNGQNSNNTVDKNSGSVNTGDNPSYVPDPNPAYITQEITTDPDEIRVRTNIDTRADNDSVKVDIAQEQATDPEENSEKKSESGTKGGQKYQKFEADVSVHRVTNDSNVNQKTKLDRHIPKQSGSNRNPAITVMNVAIDNSNETNFEAQVEERANQGRLSGSETVSSESDNYELLSKWITKYNDVNENNVGCNEVTKKESPSQVTEKHEEPEIADTSSLNFSEKDSTRKTQSKTKLTGIQVHPTSTQKKDSKDNKRQKHNSGSGNSTLTIPVESPENIPRSNSESYENNRKNIQNMSDQAKAKSNIEGNFSEAFTESTETKPSFTETISELKKSNGKIAVRRKSPLNLKKSDESGYESNTSVKNRNTSETSDITVEIINEENPDTW